MDHKFQKGDTLVHKVSGEKAIVLNLNEQGYALSMGIKDNVDYKKDFIESCFEKES